MPKLIKLKQGESYNGTTYIVVAYTYKENGERYAALAVAERYQTRYHESDEKVEWTWDSKQSVDDFARDALTAFLDRQGVVSDT